MTMRRSFWHVTLLLTLAIAAGTLSGCETGGRLLSRDDEIQMGQEAGDDFERENGRDRDQRRNELAQRIGKRIEAVAEPPDYPYDFRVLADDTVNAVAFPGGRIYLYRGIFKALDYNEAQLAFVAGHEATHVARRHASRRLEKQLGYELLIQLAFGKDTGGEIAGLVAGLMLQEYSRDNEYEADRNALGYMFNAGYDPTAALPVIAKFQELQGSDPNNFELLFMTHPGNTDRSDAIKKELSKNGWSGAYYRP